VKARLIRDLEIAVKRVDHLERQRDEQQDSDARFISQIREM